MGIFKRSKMTQGPQKILKLLNLRSDFTRSVLTLVSGTALAQMISVGITPILTRLYSPEEFGFYVVFLATVAILSIVVTGRYEYAILAAEKDNESWLCVLLVFLLAIVASITMLLIGIAVLELVVSFTNTEIHYSIVLLASFSLLLHGFYQSLYYWSNRNKKYKQLANNRILGAIGVASVSSLLGFLGFGYYGLIIGSIAGQLISTMLLVFQNKSNVRQYESYYKDKFISEVKRSAVKFKDYPLYLIPSGFLDRLSSQLHIILMSSFFGAAVSGAIGLYQKVVSLPVSVVGNAFGDVFKQRASTEIIEKGECKKLFSKTGIRLFAVALIPFLVLVLYAPPLFSFVFGAQWETAGVYAQTLSWMFLFGFVVSPLSNLFYIAQKQKYDLYMQIFLITVTSTSLVAGYVMDSIQAGLIFFTLAYCVKYVIEYAISYNIAIGRI